MGHGSTSRAPEAREGGAGLPVAPWDNRGDILRLAPVNASTGPVNGVWVYRPCPIDTCQWGTQANGACYTGLQRRGIAITGLSSHWGWVEYHSSGTPPGSRPAAQCACAETLMRLHLIQSGVALQPRGSGSLMPRAMPFSLGCVCVCGGVHFHLLCVRFVLCMQTDLMSARQL